MYLKELELSSNHVGRGHLVRSDVIKIQDWLRLNKFDVGASGSDGDFGPATERAVKAYQDQKGYSVTGVVDSLMWYELTQPLRQALSFRAVTGNFGEAVVQVAKVHLSMKAVELDSNRGPWVRTYCQGPDGPDWSWCQGFASTVWQQAAEALYMQPPIDLNIFDSQAGRTIWCLYVPTMMSQALKQSRLIQAEMAVNNPELVPSGSMFYLRGGSHGWSHVGIVIGPAKGGYYPTIEGNTNAGGATNGGEVCLRRRAISSSDYGLSR